MGENWLTLTTGQNFTYWMLFVPLIGFSGLLFQLKVIIEKAQHQKSISICLYSLCKFTQQAAQ